MQQAYFSESNAYGGWTLIGYTAPGKDGVTNNFTFDDGATLAVDGTTKDGVDDAWVAKNNVKLNDCEIGEHWVVKLTAVTTSEDAYAADLSDDDDGNCLALTPTFKNIGQ